MGNSDQSRPEDEIEHLSKALDAETRARLAVQKQLDRANADFEEFVSMAAHNLRESLREVVSFSQLMAETRAGHLDSDGNLFLDRIQEGATRAQALLTAVVDYWATDTGDRRASRTDMEGVLHQALLCTESLIRERAAEVTHDSLPAVMGDFQMLTKVLHHLIRNAIEYCDTPSPRVHISSRRDGLQWSISVQDNGPGIEPAFQERVFGVFRRLHGKEHPGNGLGLAFCKKAIEWHEGRIWVESTPGAGSTFHFTLPPAD